MLYPTKHATPKPTKRIQSITARENHRVWDRQKPDGCPSRVWGFILIVEDSPPSLTRNFSNCLVYLSKNARNATPITNNNMPPRMNVGAYSTTYGRDGPTNERSPPRIGRTMRSTPIPVRPRPSHAIDRESSRRAVKDVERPAPHSDAFRPALLRCLTPKNPRDV